MFDIERFITKTDRIIAKAREKAAIRLQWGEPAFKLPIDVKERIKNALTEAIDKGLTRYTSPAGLEELRSIIVDKLKEKNKINASVEEIVVTVGGTAALSFIFKILAKDNFIVIPDPGWFAYPPVAHIVGADIIYVPEERYGYEELLKAKAEAERRGKKLKAIVINSPSNPSGYIYSKAQLKEILDFAEDYSIFVISDEVYEDFVLKGKHVSAASLNKERVLSVFSLSKTYSLTGLRIGYIVAPDESLAKKIAIAQLHTYVCPPSITQYVAMICIREKIEGMYIKEWLKGIEENVEYVAKALLERNIRWREPMGGIYVWFPLPKVDSAKFAEKLLEEKGVGVAIGEDFGTRWQEYIRVLSAVDGQVFREGLTRIFDLYDNLMQLTIDSKNK